MNNNINVENSMQEANGIMNNTAENKEAEAMMNSADNNRNTEAMATINTKTKKEAGIMKNNASNHQEAATLNNHKMQKEAMMPKEELAAADNLMLVTPNLPNYSYSPMMSLSQASMRIAAQYDFSSQNIIK